MTRTYNLRSNFLPPINNGLSMYFDMTYVSLAEGAVNLKKEKISSNYVLYLCMRYYLESNLYIDSFRSRIIFPSTVNVREKCIHTNVLVLLSRDHFFSWDNLLIKKMPMPLAVIKRKKIEGALHFLLSSMWQY